MYIGQSVDVKNRWYEHRGDLRNNKHYNQYLQNAWNKYGEENFEFIILEECISETLNNKECHWINFYDAQNKQHGYNLREGGNQKYTISEETKEKLRKASKGKIFTKERNNKISTALKGKEFSKEHKENISLKRKIMFALNNPEWYKNKTYATKGIRRGENNPSATTTEQQALQIIELLLNGVSNKSISKVANVSVDVVCKIKTKKAWLYLTKDIIFPSKKGGESNK